MSKIVQVRGLSEEAHDELVQAASSRGVSLSQYLRSELEAIARRAAAARHNAAVVREAKAALGTAVGRDAILAALDEDRRG